MVETNIKNSRKGEIATILTFAALVMIGVSTIISTAFLKNDKNKIAYQSRADECRCFSSGYDCNGEPCGTSPPSQEDGPVSQPQPTIATEQPVLEITPGSSKTPSPIPAPTLTLQQKYDAVQYSPDSDYIKNCECLPDGSFGGLNCKMPGNYGIDCNKRVDWDYSCACDFSTGKWIQKAGQGNTCDAVGSSCKEFYEKWYELDKQNSSLKSQQYIFGPPKDTSKEYVVAPVLTKEKFKDLAAQVTKQLGSQSYKASSVLGCNQESTGKMICENFARTEDVDGSKYPLGCYVNPGGKVADCFSTLKIQQVITKKSEVQGNPQVVVSRPDRNQTTQQPGIQQGGRIISSQNPNAAVVLARDCIARAGVLGNDTCAADNGLILEYCSIACHEFSPDKKDKGCAPMPVYNKNAEVTYYQIPKETKNIIIRGLIDPKTHDELCVR